MKRQLETTMFIERDGEEIGVSVHATFYPGCVGRRANRWDRFAEPDDPPEMQDVTAVVCEPGPGFSNGETVELTEDEIDIATDKLFEALEDL